jgi:hypothetical protein
MNRYRCSVAFQAIALLLWTAVFNRGDMLHHLLCLSASAALIGALALSYLVPR